MLQPAKVNDNLIKETASLNRYLMCSLQWGSAVHIRGLCIPKLPCQHVHIQFIHYIDRLFMFVDYKAVCEWVWTREAYSSHSTEAKVRAQESTTGWCDCGTDWNHGASVFHHWLWSCPIKYVLVVANNVAWMCVSTIAPCTRAMIYSIYRCVIWYYSKFSWWWNNYSLWV